MSDSSALPKTCPQCGVALPSDAAEGLCPRCLMAEAMQPTQAGAGAMPDADAQTIPVAKPAASQPRNDTPELPLPEELTALLPHGMYRVEGFLGQGGMGAVYKGMQVRLKRSVAIKIMRRDQGQDYGFEQRFEREAQAMAKLSHPNIVGVIDYGEAGPNYLYIVMELVDGADLMDVIRTGRMTQEMALTLLPQICDALQFAHDHGIVHRDIKPSNIMLTRDGRVKMADFGLAKPMDAVESSFRTQTGTGMGTPDYAAPEQFDPKANIDHRADIYALGVMIYQMITGTLPRGVWKPPSQRAEVAPEWDEVVSRAMQSDPKDRYQQASEVKTDVSRIKPESTADTPVRIQPPPPQSGANKAADRSVRSTPNRRAPLLLGLITGAVVIALGAFYALKQPVGDDVRSLTSSPADTTGAEATKDGQPGLVTSSPTAIVSIPGLPDLPPLSIPPGEPGLVKEFEVKGGYLKGIQLLPDNRRVLVFPGRSVALIDLETETPVWSITGGTISSSALNEDGARFVSYELQTLDGKSADQVKSQQAQIKLHDTATGRLIQSWTVPTTPMDYAYGQAALSPSGKRIVARTGGTMKTGMPGTSEFVGLEEGKETPVARWTAPGHHGWTTLAIDEERYLSTGLGALVLMSFAKPGETAALLGDKAKYDSALSMDKRHLVAGEAGGKAVWNLATRQREFYLERAPSEGVPRFAGNGLILSAENGQIQTGGRKALHVWDGSTGKLLAKFANAKPDETFSDLLAAATSGAFCVTRVLRNPVGKTGNTLQIWRLPKPGQVHASVIAAGGEAEGRAAAPPAAASGPAVTREALNK